MTDLFNSPLADVDPEVADAIGRELERQQRTLEMIASEKALFGAEHANVQPHSGAQANAAVYHALLDPGDTIMGLALPHGGHLTHGMKINVSGKLYDIAPYEVSSETYLIDMDEVARIARERRPKLIVAGWSAYPRQLNFAGFPGQQGGPLEHVIAGKAVALKIAATDQFRERQQRTLDGARAVAEELLNAGSGVNVLTGGTDVHLVLVDLRESDLDGQQAEDRLHSIGVTVNRNAVPFDPRPPMVTSGLRVGTPALATRGVQVEDFQEVGKIIATALTPKFDAARDDLAERVTAIADRYPLYAQLRTGSAVAAAS